MSRTTLVLVSVTWFIALGCAKPCEDTESELPPLGKSTGTADVKLVNGLDRPIFVLDECCYPAFLTIEGGYIWSHGNHFCGTSTTHNDPNARVVRLEPGESMRRTWSGLFYQLQGSAQSECIRSVYALAGAHSGRVCAFIAEPNNPLRPELVTQPKETPLQNSIT